jgi:hypothetical protein
MGTKSYFAFGTVTYKTPLWKRQLFEKKLIPVLESRTHNSERVFLSFLQLNAEILNANDVFPAGEFPSLCGLIVFLGRLF